MGTDNRDRNHQMNIYDILDSARKLDSGLSSGEIDSVISFLKETRDRVAAAEREKKREERKRRQREEAEEEKGRAHP